MMWLRFIMIGVFAFTAINLFAYQGVGITYAITDLTKNK
ncbi:hypothetical protein SAMN05192534_110109 [Alteribacillus persepolensis]|uniref:Uncharacterized protein n=1 Tax=Alteribacillus persepolensis TaxID=568899 RepID=A0A1G8EXM5_9BACI|nr:hypothetical protein SAMN05192534_110109 [Alteribacillus persepolensis]